MRVHDRRITDVADPIEQVTRWKPPMNEEERRRLPQREPCATLFTHWDYTAQDWYPEGLADVVGYWAEDRILGGVVLFDRSRTWRTRESERHLLREPNFFMQSGRCDVTRRLWQVKDGDQRALTDFLLSPTGSTRGSGSNNGPLPLLPTSHHWVRIDPEYTAVMVNNKVYRDGWEWRPPTNEFRFMQGDDRRPRNEMDYPEVADELAAIHAIFDKKPTAGS